MSPKNQPIAEHHTGSIEVLITDVIMPQIRELELAKRVTDLHLDICVIFMSGYSEMRWWKTNCCRTGT